MPKERKLIELLVRKRLTLSTAESCTGGLLSHRLTNIPGSSKAFLCGIIAYSNASKTRILKVPKSVTKAKGAVSAETAKLMAINARRIPDASIGIAITGIAGPGGGTKLKPAGTVFIAVSGKKKTYVQKFLFSGNRLQIKRKSVDKALDMILKEIK
ncbi:CinA family protein [bacterium]|nr:MAG: CinA family protein [bacterium]